MKGDDSIDEHIAKFKAMVTEAKADTDSPMVIDLFRETLTIPLMRRIMTIESPPTTLKGWYEWAEKLDHSWRKMQKIVGRTQGNQKGKSTGGQPPRRFYFQKKERDPNAMDVDALTLDE